MKVLMVLTSHDRLGDTGKKTGFWLEEFAAPYYVFKDAGAEVVLASPKGGQPPLDPKSEEAAARPTQIVPFLVEDMLTSNGGAYSKGPDWQSCVVIDGKLITGQNPASSAEAARAALAQWRSA